MPGRRKGQASGPDTALRQGASARRRQGWSGRDLTDGPAFGNRSAITHERGAGTENRTKTRRVLPETKRTSRNRRNRSKRKEQGKKAAKGGALLRKEKRRSGLFPPEFPAMVGASLMF